MHKDWPLQELVGGDGGLGLWAPLVPCAVILSHLSAEPAMKIYVREKESTHIEKVRQEQNSGRKPGRAGQ